LRPSGWRTGSAWFPPVSLRRVLDALGILLYAAPSPGGAWDAAYWREGDRRIILLNDSIPYGRKRFSLAHEIGHARLGHASALPGEGKRLERPLWQERQADAFAAELLMPRRHVLAEPREVSARSLAERYRVSPTAMLIRLKELGLRPRDRA
jgi:Zn-dependent peptidase ImmA (M78 family)